MHLHRSVIENVIIFFCILSAGRGVPQWEQNVQAYLKLYPTHLAVQ